MLHFICALHCEALPIVSELGLKRDFKIKAFEHFKNDKASLSICGIGKLNASFVVGYLSEQFFDENCVLVNFGSAGCADSKISKGTLLIVKSIEDVASQRKFYPDLLVKSDLPYAELQTFDKAVTKAERPRFLVDMEAAGFYHAAQKIVTAHRIAVLKLVSDHLVNFEFQPKKVENYVKVISPHLLKYVYELEAFALKEGITIPRLSNLAIEMLEALKVRLKFTERMCQEIEHLALDFEVRHLHEEVDVVSVLRQFYDLEVRSKEQGRKIYHGLCEALAS